MNRLQFLEKKQKQIESLWQHYQELNNPTQYELSEAFKIYAELDNLAEKIMKLRVKYNLPTINPKATHIE